MAVLKYQDMGCDCPDISGQGGLLDRVCRTWGVTVLKYQDMERDCPEISGQGESLS